MRCWILLVALAFAGCSGGNGGNSDASTVSSERIAGVWTGSHTRTVYECIMFVCAPHHTETVPAMALAASNGHLHLVSDAAGAGYAGIARVSSRRISGRLNHRCDPLDGPPIFGHMDIDGTYSARRSMQIAYDFDECIGDGVFNLTFHEASYRPPSQSAVTGTWASAEIAITIDADGRFNGASNAGCQLSGSILPGTDSVNIYRVSLLIENCNGADGQYAGLASVVSDNPGQDILLIGGIKADGMTWFGLTR
jgi:hypothetical protein